MKVAIYGRVSTKDKGQDVENQLLQLRRFVASQPGWTICQEYTDQKSGRSADRAEFQRLFQDAYEKRFDMMLFWSLNRFSREGATDTLQHLRKLASYGVQWKSRAIMELQKASITRWRPSIGKHTVSVTFRITECGLRFYVGRWIGFRGWPPLLA